MKKEKAVEMKFDFNNVDDAKRYLHNLWVGTQAVTGVQTHSSGWLDFGKMTDDQLMDCASELYSEWGAGTKKSHIEWRPPVLN